MGNEVQVSIHMQPPSCSTFHL
uniref:Uncharacterized protein n=1 Tax=Anguilla anguilla TaxID=7936 RepID=A0A0E9V0H0_ANGAN